MAHKLGQMRSILESLLPTGSELPESGDYTPTRLSPVYSSEKVGIDRRLEQQRAHTVVNSLYYQRNGYWYKIPRRVAQNPTEAERNGFCLPLEREFVPPTFFETLSPPLPSSYREPFRLSALMGRKCPSGLTFTGDNGIGVKTFLNRMKTWFAMMEEDFNGDSVAARRKRAAQIRMACPIGLEANTFVDQLPEEVQNDDQKLSQALIAQFHDVEDDGSREDILSIMHDMEQGDHNVFTYSYEVLKLLRRKPAEFQQYDKMLTLYYIDGLTSQRLRQMAVMSFLKPDSKETPHQVVRGVMRFATQLKLRGYQKAGGCQMADQSDNDTEGESSSDEDIDSDGDSDVERTYKFSKKFARKSKSTSRHLDWKSKHRSKKKNLAAESDLIRNEFKELKDMMRDLLKEQKPTVELGTVSTRREPEVIPLDSYTVGPGYGGVSQQHQQYRPRPEGPGCLPVGQASDFVNSRGLPRVAFGTGRDHAVGSSSFPNTQYNRGLRAPMNQSYGNVNPPTSSTNMNYQPNTEATPIRGPIPSQPIVGPNGVLYYPARNRPVCYNCGEEGHIRPYCPRLMGYDGSHQRVAPESVYGAPPQTNDSLPRQPLQVPVPDKPVSVVEIATCSSALDGMKIREVSSAEANSQDLMKFVHKLAETDDSDNDDYGDGSDSSERGVPVMAGERARRFSELPADFDGEEGPAAQRVRHRYVENEDEVEEVLAGGRKIKSTSKRSADTPTSEEQVLAVATDRNLGEVANFYTRGVVSTPAGKFYVSRILVDAGSIVNLMPIHLLRSMGVRLQKAGGMVIRTATNSVAKIAYCTDVRITIADIPCDLRVYALPEEYKPTYPMLLSRRWLQAVKAKGDYASGKYYIMSKHGTRVRIPSDECYKSNTQSTLRKHRPRVPIIMRDKNMSQKGLSAEVEEELELQKSGGNRFFEELVELIRKQAKEQMREEDEYEDEEEDVNMSSQLAGGGKLGEELMEVSVLGSNDEDRKIGESEWIFGDVGKVWEEVDNLYVSDVVDGVSVESRSCMAESSGNRMSTDDVEGFEKQDIYGGKKGERWRNIEWSLEMVSVWDAGMEKKEAGEINR
ncbi:hypothetical protein HOY82DRAFT_536688 [Tuber indicum]|nr:hypothetical protein HOY82DRAFT_536688 [Tuber indicum]